MRVFISYRRGTSKHLARAIFMDLRQHRYDVFLDVSTIASGEFDTIILTEIAARAHFVVLLSPGALERCIHPGDWLRREIEQALRLRRNIVPIIEEGFDFEQETRYLPDPWRDEFKRHNGLRLFHDYFEAGMDTLRNRFLREAAELHVSQPFGKPRANMPGAEKYFNRALERGSRGDLDGAIADYTEAIRLNPNHANAYWARGNCHYQRRAYRAALKDYERYLGLAGAHPSEFVVGRVKELKEALK